MEYNILLTKIQKKLGISIFFVVTFVFFLVQNVAATTYCYYPPGAYYVEGENKREWIMTASKYRKILIPTNNKPSTSCAVNFSNLGSIKNLKIIRKPVLNNASIPNSYQINYQAIKMGSDTMSVEIEWLDRSNSIRKGVVHYDIKIVDHEL